MLNAPAKPRSAVTATSRCVLSLPVPASSGGAVGLPTNRGGEGAEHPLHPLGIGPRRFRLHSCARRSFDAATIFIAEVIFCVDFTLLMVAEVF